MKNMFAVTHAKTGMQVDQQTWENWLKPGLHIEQAMVIKRAHKLKSCMDPKCPGTLQDQPLEFDQRKTW